MICLNSSLRRLIRCFEDHALVFFPLILVVFCKGCFEQTRILVFVITSPDQLLNLVPCNHQLWLKQSQFGGFAISQNSFQLYSDKFILFSCFIPLTYILFALKDLLSNYHDFVSILILYFILNHIFYFSRYIFATLIYLYVYGYRHKMKHKQWMLVVGSHKGLNSCEI